MLQDIRQNVQGTTAKIIVGLIVITFAFFGIESILVGGGGNEIAEVNGQEIYPQQLQQAIDTQRRRLIAMMGENIDPAMLDEERLKPQAMEALINRKLLMQSAQDMDLAISEREIGAVVGSMEEFQVDGVFSPEVYKSVLSSAGYTPNSFKQSLRDDLLLNQLRSGLAGSDFATPAELELNTLVISELRDLRYFTIPAEKFASASPVNEEDIEDYYHAHQSDYRTPESVDIDYIDLTLDDFRGPVEESAVLEAFELAKQEARYQTQNRVSHILFETGGDTSEQQLRIAQAQEQLVSGVAFADVAREFSEDVGSAARGGDLGFSSGDAFPEDMEAVIAQLEPGMISSPVTTEAGTHLIVVTERKPGEEPTLDQIRPQLEDDIQADQARIELLRTVEALKDLSFNSEDLSLPADELNLEVQQLDGFSELQKEGLFSNQQLLDAAFSEEVLVSGHNSDVIEMPGDRFIVLRVRNHHEPEVQPLEVVRDQVVASVEDNNARAAVAEEADLALAQLRGGVSVEKFASTRGYEWQVELGVDRQNRTVSPQVLRRVFELPEPAPGTTTSDFVMTQNGDAVVLELVRVSPGDYLSLEENQKQQLQQLLGAETGSLINSEFQRRLRTNASIIVL